MSSAILNPRPSFCIWCGSPAEGDVALRCTSCGRTHYLNSKISASALVVVDDNYLTVRRAAPPEQHRWDVPGGFCELREDPADTAVRETLEETGIRIIIERLLGVFMDEYIEPDGQPWPTINLLYLAIPETTSADPASVDVREVSEIAWHPLASPPADVAFPAQQLGAIAAYLYSTSAPS